ncbi:MAG: hypothetical protein PSV23_02880 [Brevundimonas sp.]|uniref:HAAS signaling domain-containing protein n=1 Tax=Brevundimonas sp. TaxID=1871086 RepID=UPI0024886473|nr:hypothetical protein [Brevundimonas sp.]MDI1325723.1 hypothetical protein [Brevundimonas sp.]
MDMIDRYLNAVAAQLPQDERADIIAELRDLILSRFEAKEEELGRPLTEDEQEAILREIGHPLVVAARYRKGPDRLVGPELFPYWLFGVKAGLLVLLAVQAIGLFIHLISGPADSGQAIGHAFHGFFGSALTLIGVATVAAAVFEHYDIRPKWMTQWRVKDLGAFGLSDPAAWGASVAGTETAKQTWRLRPAKAWPGADYAFSFVVVGMFALWWVGLLHFPGVAQVRLLGAEAAVTPAPIWSTLFAPILIYALVQMTVDLNSLFRPHAVRLRAAARLGVAAGGLWLTWAIWEAGHWFTLTDLNGETARIAGDGVTLDFEALRTLGDGARDLVGVASTLSVVLVWALAISAISLASSMVLNLWRLARP